MKTLLLNIKQDRITAMKNGDKATRETLQLLLAKIEKAQIESKKVLTDSDIESIVVKSLKELDKEIESYIAVGRTTEKQEQEKVLLLNYLPKQLTEDEIKEIVIKVAEETKKSGGKIGDALKAL